MIDFSKPPQGPGSPYNAQRAPSLALTSEALFFGKIYAWMFGGLILSSLVAYFLAGSYAWHRFLGTTGYASILIFVLQIGLCMGMSFLINRVSAAVIMGMFALFAMSMGMTFSLVILVYPSNVIFKAFMCAASVYGAMAAYGLLTKRSLEAWGAFLFMGLIGLIISSLVNLLLKSPGLDFVICWVGVLVFAGLTAYDHQKLRVIHSEGFGDRDTESKAVVMGALSLYLDFINLFLFLIRIFGNRD
jgi:FtsH-binding integral membrane protein